MKLMIYTGYFDYETFADGNNNIFKDRARVFDISTDEKFRAAKVFFIKQVLLQWDYYFAYSDINLDKPEEPSFTMKEMKDTDLVAERTKEYELAMEEYEASQRKYRERVSFFSRLQNDDVHENDDHIIDEVFDMILENDKNQDYRYPAVYFKDLEDLSL